jgi:hypothetical protein
VLKISLEETISYKERAQVFKLKFQVENFLTDPFFRLSVKPPGFEREIPLYRSEYIEKNLEPQWRPFKLNVVDVGGLDVPIKGNALPVTIIMYS